MQFRLADRMVLQLHKLHCLVEEPQRLVKPAGLATDFRLHEQVVGKPNVQIPGAQAINAAPYGLQTLLQCSLSSVLPRQKDLAGELPARRPLLTR